MTSERRIMVVLAGVIAIAAVWFMLVSPKRAEVADLDSQIAAAETSASEQEQLAALAEQSKTTYRADYQDLVILGKAVPGDDDVSSLVEQVNGLAGGVNIKFSSLKLSASSGATEVAAPAPIPPPTTPPAEGAPEGTAVPAAATAAPTEAAAALLPLGAAVGPAGLPTMPYDLTFTGDFFDIADFMAGLDSMVKVDQKGIGVDGRLLTIDGFSLSADDGGFPHLKASLHVTSYVAPADQGLTAGATATAPAEATPTTTPATTAPPLAMSSVPTQ
jgi:Tfp pilus assembly protein PilO